MKSTKKLTLAGLFLALGYVLPMLTGQIQVIGQQLLPMHIPVLFCGLICGWEYGLLVGIILPVTRSLFFGMPPMYPVALAMAAELGTYGAVAGLLWKKSRYHCLKWLYISLIGAMLAGRIVWGLAEIVLLGMQGNAFTLSAWLAGAFAGSVPGIVLQLVLIPVVMVLAGQAKVRQSQLGKTSEKNYF